jgi:hypothetical protein
MHALLSSFSHLLFFLFFVTAANRNIGALHGLLESKSLEVKSASGENIALLFSAKASAKEPLYGKDGKPQVGTRKFFSFLRSSFPPFLSFSFLALLPPLFSTPVISTSSFGGSFSSHPQGITQVEKKVLVDSLSDLAAAGDKSQGKKDRAAQRSVFRDILATVSVRLFFFPAASFVLVFFLSSHELLNCFARLCLFWFLLSLSLRRWYQPSSAHRVHYLTS